MRKNLQKILLLAGAFVFVAGGWYLLADKIKQNAPATVGQSNLIRLHVLANSDSPKDQQLKLKVRDAVITHLAPQLEHISDAQAARAVVQNNRNKVIEIAQNVLTENGCDDLVDIQLGLFDFPVKSYGSFVLPAGKYEAVRILIGNAEGKNWWCVLFPPLCFIDITTANAAAIPIVANNDQQSSAEPAQFSVQWKIVEVWDAIKP